MTDLLFSFVNYLYSLTQANQMNSFMIITENALFLSLPDFKETCYLQDYTHENDRELNNFNCVKIAQFCIDFWAQTMVQQNSQGLNLKSGVLLIRRHKISDEENYFFLGRPSQLHILVPSVNIALECGRGKFTTWTAEDTVSIDTVAAI